MLQSTKKLHVQNEKQWVKNKMKLANAMREVSFDQWNRKMKCITLFLNIHNSRACSDADFKKIYILVEYVSNI
jgi:hypothetical protein